MLGGLQADSSPARRLFRSLTIDRAQPMTCQTALDSDAATMHQLLQVPEAFGPQDLACGLLSSNPMLQRHLAPTAKGEPLQRRVYWSGARHHFRCASAGNFSLPRYACDLLPLSSWKQRWLVNLAAHNDIRVEQLSRLCIKTTHH